MSRKLDADIKEWATDVMRHVHKSAFSGINAVERILRQPGNSTKGSNHRVLWWPRNRRISKMSKAMHQIDSVSQVCLIINAELILNDDNTIFSFRDLAKNSSLTVGRARGYVTKSKRKLRKILRGFGKSEPGLDGFY